MPKRPLPKGEIATPKRLVVVGIGASAGGLEACTKLVAAVPPGSGMAFILVQHLDPLHRSMMVELLAKHTKLKVLQAGEAMQVEPEHLYVIPPAMDMAVQGGALHLSPRRLHDGLHLPFDFLLRSMAEAYGASAACVVLSGTGADGSAGLLAIKEKGGFVIVQDPAEADYDGMPRSAVQTGGVDAVLPAAEIAAALGRFRQGGAQNATTPASQAAAAADEPEPDAEDAADPSLQGVIDLLRTEKAQDFTAYKSGTLQRRVERRMALASIKLTDMAQYIRLLRADRRELDLLAEDLLIHVTSFFRDPAVFEHLANVVIPAIVDQRNPDQPVRIWVPGCSTGEEAYSLAMLFLERIATTGRAIKLQIFASDIDAAAITAGRSGFYPDAVASQVTPHRLARFFSREDGGWRVLPDVRATIVFTVQDVLTDPPFSLLDLVSCRNLLIYLQPEAQEKLLSLLHFALREDGLLVLGNAETPAAADGGFEVVARTERIYRRVAQDRADRPRKAMSAARLGSAASVPAAPGPSSGAARAPSRPTEIAELGRRLLAEAYAPAAVLVNADNKSLFSMGPTDRYLRTPSGHATHDLLAMARPGLRAKLRSAIETARGTKAKAVASCRVTDDGRTRSFNVEVHPAATAGQAMLLVCFVDAPEALAMPDDAAGARQAPRVAELEKELDATRTELEGLVRDLELSSEDQKAINEEALSVNEEYQSTNEELLASKEELQSLNEELTALNSQLQETLERECTTADDLQNVLDSTNVATLFLDLDLCIRFFTPATKSLFAIIASDVGRPLSDLAALAPDNALEADARAVLQGHAPPDLEIEGKEGAWFRRRILPYRVHGDRVEGVVITFTDVTTRKRAARALEAAKRQAEGANAAKSRFLAAASHDLRQPLQTLTLLAALLARTVESQKAKSLTVRLDDTLGAMAAMLDTLLDINEIEAGVVQPVVTSFAADGLLERMREEFTYHAEAKGLALRVVPCGLLVRSDLRLLEQMVRNLLSNALKYTAHGKVLLGCRREGGLLRVEIWDSGIGIPAAELDTIFDEYRQVGNAARERSRGLGLGLSIVKRLGGLLGHPISVHSRPGKGSVFAVSVPWEARAAPAEGAAAQGVASLSPAVPAERRGTILVVEDDTDLRELLALLLTGEGYAAVPAADGPAALGRMAQGRLPDLLLADYNLPNGLSGAELAARVRDIAGRPIPVVILTGDISAETQQEIAQHGFAQLNKPVRQAELVAAIHGLLVPMTTPATAPAPSAQPAAQPCGAASSAAPATVYFVDDDPDVRTAVTAILEDDGHFVAAYATGEAFLQAYQPNGEGCVLIDAYLPGMSGFDLLEQVRSACHRLPAIMFTGRSDVSMAVRAMKAGAVDFIEKPVGRTELLASIARALGRSRDVGKAAAWQEEAAGHLAGLTARQRQIMALVLAGQPSKNIAADLGISQRTVENHRASVMRKTGSASLPALARLAMAAVPDGGGEPPDASSA